MPTKISNTNTNINKININVPRRYTPRPTKKNVAKAEQELSQVENIDREIPYISQAPSQFINPSVFGFNTTPIQEPVRPQTISRGTQTEEMATSPRVPVAEVVDSSEFMPQRGDTPASPMPFRSNQAPDKRDALTLGYSQPEYTLNKPSDFSSRLSQAEGSAFPSSGSSFKMPIYRNRMRDIQKQGRPDLDINEMARNVKEAYRSTPQEEEIPFVKSAGTSSRAVGDDEAFGISPNAVVDEVLEVPPAKTAKGGRRTGSKNKPKPVSQETQTEASLQSTPATKQRKTKVISVPVGVDTPKFEESIATAGGGLRGKGVTFSED